MSNPPRLLRLSETEYQRLESYFLDRRFFNVPEEWWAMAGFSKSKAMDFLWERQRRQRWVEEQLPLVLHSLGLRPEQERQLSLWEKLRRLFHD